jgi:hypothetical protein
MTATGNSSTRLLMRSPVRGSEPLVIVIAAAGPAFSSRAEYRPETSTGSGGPAQ